MIQCIGCGLPFMPRRHDSRFCDQRCYNRWLDRTNSKRCAEPDCDRGVRARGLCASHYNRAHAKPWQPVALSCGVCGRETIKHPKAGQVPTCSRRCQSYVQHGRYSEQGKELVGPVPRRPIARPRAKPRATKVRFASVTCHWCGTQFLCDLRTTRGSGLRWCSKRCIRKATKARRRAQAFNAGGTYTWSEVMRLYLKFGGCAYCGQRSTDIEPDHVMPLCKGGSNSITNVVPACRSCNSDKGSRTLEQWYTSREERGLPAARLTNEAIHLTTAA